MLGGTRAILYFGARGDADLTHALIVVAAEIVFWGIVGLGVTEWYDRRPYLPGQGRIALCAKCA